MRKDYYWVIVDSNFVRGEFGMRSDVEVEAGGEI